MICRKNVDVEEKKDFFFRIHKAKKIEYLEEDENTVGILVSCWIWKEWNQEGSWEEGIWILGERKIGQIC